MSSTRSRGTSTPMPFQQSMTFYRSPPARTSPHRGREVGLALHRAVNVQDACTGDQSTDLLAATPSSSRDESNPDTPRSPMETDENDSGTDLPTTPATPDSENAEEDGEDRSTRPPSDSPCDMTSSPDEPPLLTLAVSPRRSRPDRPASPPARPLQVTFAQNVARGSPAPRSRPRSQAVTTPAPRPQFAATSLPRRTVSTNSQRTTLGQGQQGVSAGELVSGMTKGVCDNRSSTNGRQRISFDTPSHPQTSRYFYPGNGNGGKSVSLSPDPSSDSERPSGRLAARFHAHQSIPPQGGDHCRPSSIPCRGIDSSAVPMQRVVLDDVQVAKALNVLHAHNHRGEPGFPAMAPSHSTAPHMTGQEREPEYSSAADRYAELFCPPGGECFIDPGHQTQQVYMVGASNRGGNSQYLPPPNPYLRAPNATLSSQLAAPAPNPIQRVKGKEAKLPKYDAKEAFEMYLQRYELVADYNGWDEMERAAQLVFLLAPGEFQTVRNIQVRIPGSYRLIVDALTQQYGASNNRIRSLAIFRNRRQQQHETLMAFSLALKGLAEFAYPLLDETAREGLAIDQFVRNVADHTTSKLLLQDNTLHTLNDAVTKAVIIESAETEASANKPRTQAANRYDRYPNVMAIGRETADARAEIAQLARQVGELRHDTQTRVVPKTEPTSNYPATRARAFITAHAANDRVSIICFRCGVPGHIAKMCRGKRANGHSREGDQPEKRQCDASYPRDAPRSGNDQRAATPNARTAGSASPRLHDRQ